MYDFSNVQLKLNERRKLFFMRFVKSVSADYLGKTTFALCMSYKFIESDYPFSDTTPTDQKIVKQPRYHLTDKYDRYCIYRRQKFFDKAVWPFLISVGAAIITSIITSMIASYFVSRQVSDEMSIEAIERLIERLL